MQDLFNLEFKKKDQCREKHANVDDDESMNHL